jgi:hypothetical protein
MSGHTDDRRPEAELGPLHEAAACPPSAAAFPVDHSREVPALAALARRGFTAELIADGDAVRVAGSAKRFAPDDIRIRDFYRFEGTSDPDSMSVIYAIEARDGTRGTLTDAFGAYASPDVGALLDRVPVEPFARRCGSPRLALPLALGALAVGAAVALVRRRPTTSRPGSIRRAA